MFKSKSLYMKKLFLSFFPMMLSLAMAAQPKIMSHRGFYAKEGAFENTLTALKNAQEFRSDAVELDAHLTVDDSLVVLHGPKIAKTQVEAQKSTFEQVRACTLPNGDKVPTLREYFAQAKQTPSLMLFLELKSHPTPERETQLAEKVLSLCDEMDMYGQTVFISFSYHLCDEVLRLHPGARVMPISSTKKMPEPAALKQKGYVGVSYYYGVVKEHPEWLDQAREAGMETVLWPVNDLPLVDVAKAHGVTWVSTDHPDEMRYLLAILTPPAPETPRINGPKVYGARPGADFLFKIPATGVRPMTFAATGLPKGLSLDEETGIITGRAKKAGTYIVTLRATNALGENERELRIVIGDKIALTPPLGWNSWNVWGNSVSQEKVLSSARAMLKSGLADYGWSYINIDDGWQGLRGGKYNAIQPNKKFPDMKGMVDELHAAGLKVGIYSGPWVATYAGHIGTGCDNAEGTYWWVEKGLVDEVCKLDRSKLKRDSLWYFGAVSFAREDAMQWADWGIDYLKYDWGPNDLWHLKDMHDALRATGRDIVYSISNSGKIPMAPYLERYAECWRTTGDIRDEWKNMSKIGFGGQDQWGPYKKPGRWPDADMLVVGKVGWGPKTHRSRLTPDEQYTHMTLWSILASPMLIGCDMADMDAFTRSLLCNNEVLDVNQDPLGLQASRVEGDWNVKNDGTYAIYCKPLEDGSVAIALFNLTTAPKRIGFVPRSLGMVGTQHLRDLWRQQDLGSIWFRDRWETEVAPHGTVFLRVTPGTTGEQIVGMTR